jgi:hypothetical protein
MAPRDLERTRGEVGPEGEKVAYRRFRIREFCGSRSKVAPLITATGKDPAEIG